MGIGLKFFIIAENRTSPVGTAQEDLEQSAAQFVRDLVQRQHNPGAGRTLDLQIVAVEQIEAAQVLDQQIIDWHPDGPAPVRVAAEHAAVGFARLVFHPVMHPVVFEIIRMVEVAAGQGPYAVGREEFGLVKHTPQELRHAEDAHQRNETAALRPRLVKT